MQTYACETAKRRTRGTSTISIAVLLLVVMLTSGGIVQSVSTNHLYEGIRFQKSTAAQMLAEAAVEDAMWHLDAVSDWSTLTLPQPGYTTAHGIGEGQAWADIDNDPAESASTTDTNGLILVKGYGQLLNSSLVETVQAVYLRPGFSLPPVAALNVCGMDLIDASGGNVLVSGFNHHLPASPCSGGGCTPSIKNNPPLVTGLAFELAGRDMEMTLPAQLEGSPQLQTGQCNLNGPSGLCDRARLLMANASRLVGIETVATWPGIGSTPYGSVSAPRFLYVAKGTTLAPTGTVQGAGVLFIEGTLSVESTFTWTGPIFVGPGGLLDIHGTANIAGAVVTAGSVANPAMINLKGTGSIAWAGDAVRAGPFNMPGLMSSWQAAR